MPVAFFVIIVAFFMILVEIARPGRQWKRVSGWWTRAFLLNGFQALSVFITTYTFDVWLKGRSFWNPEDVIGQTGGTILGYFVITFIYYWWHRWRHESQFLWNYLHQIHHSAQRIEIITAFYKHPVEILTNSFITSIILYALLGLSPQAAAQAILLTGLAELFYHWNVKTPYWLGFIIQRPESHCVHHRQGHHTKNFSDLPLWDMMFGTFDNPKEFNEKCGFSQDRETRLKEMLVGIDVLRTPKS